MAAPDTTSAERKLGGGQFVYSQQYNNTCSLIILRQVIKGKKMSKERSLALCCARIDGMHRRKLANQLAPMH